MTIFQANGQEMILMIPNDAVWLITGCSNGIGKAPADEALKQGYLVVATVRRETD